MKFTEDQIIQLAPDGASVKVGQQLANTSKWLARQVHDKALWGNCQGSGKTPYRTMIDLGNIAFKCSCPSRKFPCKHGLALFLLYAKNSSVFIAETLAAPDVEEARSRPASALEKQAQLQSYLRPVKRKKLR